MNVVAIILTKNEERHLERCIQSLNGISTKIVVVDCFSKDATKELAVRLGAFILENHWTNYSNQFNWALAQLGKDTDWILRIDADEYLTPELASNLNRLIPSLDSEVHGIYLNRRMTFQRELIRFGGVFPIHVLRLFRFGKGQCENRWMDEHIKVNGKTVHVGGELIDDNLNSLTWWIDKHNSYASREVVDLLNLEYHFMPHDTIADFKIGNQSAFKRWIKEYVYNYLPLGLRPLLYFIFRYFFMLGFLDGRAGFSFHFFQGFWYRYLVDAKLREVKRYMAQKNVDVRTAVKDVLEISI